MGRKIICLIFFVLVGLVLSEGVQAAADPNLALWYELDESGTTTDVPDSSGNNHHGTVVVWPETLTFSWDPDDGHYGGCLVFEDNIHIDVPKASLSGVKDGITVSLWLKDAWRVGQNCVFDAGTSEEAALRILAFIGTGADAEVVWRAGDDVNDRVTWDLDGGSVVDLVGWHLWTFVKDESADNIRIYFDGMPAASKSDVNDTLSTDLPGELAGISFRVGARNNHYNDLQGRMDEFRVYDRALSDDDVVRLYWSGGDVGMAWIPDPADETRNLCPDDVVLSWTPGDYAALHDVYLGTDYDAVASATTASTEHRSTQEPNSYDAGVLESLDPGVTYYWRIDEVAVHPDSPWTGDVWEFTINDGSAFDPDPADGQAAVATDAVLSWSAGCSAASHDVYFGTDSDAVEAATTASSVFRGNQALGETSYDPCDFDYDTDHYWRIDEVNGPDTWKGQVWHFRSQIDIPPDPNFVLWYKLDESEGDIAHDSTAYQRHGFVHVPGEPTGPSWDPIGGELDGCLGFSDDAGIWVPTTALSKLTDGVTVGFWAKEAVNTALNANGGDYQLRVNFEGSAVTWRAGNDTNDMLTHNLGGAPAGWHHYAFVKNETAGHIKIYYDGLPVDSNDAVANTLLNVRNKPFKIGADTIDDADLRGKLDDFMVYDRALSDEQVAGLPLGGYPELARKPYPRNGEEDVARDVVLSWEAGMWAGFHDVYFGTSWDVVNDADTNTSGVYKGEQPLGDEDYPPGTLEFDATYYWRIDEVNKVDPNVWKGRIWMFTVGRFLVIEDFEDYDDDAAMPQNPINETWIDGWWNNTGSTVFLEYGEGAILRGGAKSMLLEYDNNYGYPVEDYSEIYANTATGDKNLGFGKNWTVEGMKALTLFFYGDPSNAVEPLYVALESSTGANSVSNYGDLGQDPNRLAVAEWHEWNMDLADFNDGGVDITDVNRIYIGLGDRENPVAGGSGNLFIDDIRLYRPKCVPWLIKPAADFSDNCVVDLADVAHLGRNWLRTDVNGLAKSEPSTGPVGWWKLDDGSGNTAADSGGTPQDGTVEGSYLWVTGHIGTGAIEFIGSGGRVLVPDAAELRPADEISAAAWLNYSVSHNYAARIVTKGVDTENHENFAIQVTGDDTASWFVRDTTTELHAVDSDRGLGHDEWIHIGGLYDGNAVKCYVNGQLSNSETVGAITLLQDENPLSIGDAVDVDRAFFGKIDDVQVYDYALTDQEVAWLATEGTGYVPLRTPTNLYETGALVVNFKDYAVLMASWLDEQLFPAE